jgi:hypothetical protein
MATSETLAAVATAVWMILVLLSTPRCAFPEVPVPPLLRLVHLRIPALPAVFGRTGRVNQSRVHDRAGGNAHAFRFQVQVHRPQNLFSQVVFFQQMTELAHRSQVHGELFRDRPQSKWPRTHLGPQLQGNFIRIRAGVHRRSFCHKEEETSAVCSA